METTSVRSQRGHERGFKECLTAAETQMKTEDLSSASFVSYHTNCRMATIELSRVYLSIKCHVAFIFDVPLSNVWSFGLARNPGPSQLQSTSELIITAAELSCDNTVNNLHTSPTAARALNFNMWNASFCGTSGSKPGLCACLGKCSASELNPQLVQSAKKTN